MSGTIYIYLQSPAAIQSSDPPQPIDLLFANLFICIYIYIYVYMYRYIDIYMSVCIYLYIYIFTCNHLQSF